MGRLVDDETESVGGVGMAVSKGQEQEQEQAKYVSTDGREGGGKECVVSEKGKREEEWARDRLEGGRRT